MTPLELELFVALRWALWWIAQNGNVPEPEPDPSDPDANDPDDWRSWAAARKALKTAEHDLNRAVAHP